MFTLIKTLFLISPLLAEAPPSFSFSKEEGLRQLSAIENQPKTPSESANDNEAVSLDSKQDTETTPIVGSDLKLLDNPTKPVEETPVHSISEDFAPQETEQVKGASLLDSLIEDTSWFFEDKHSVHKIGITPNYTYDKTKGSRLGFSFFSYSPKEKGYYFNTSASLYLFRPFYRFSLSFIGNRKNTFRSKANLIYDNHYKIYYGDVKNPSSMLAKQKEQTQIHAHRFIINYDLFYQEKEQDFYFGLGARIFFRKERPFFQEDKIYFKPEGFLFLRAFAGFDTRDNWKDPKKGAFHQLSFGCKANFSLLESYCQGEGDLRFYLALFKKTDFSILKDSTLALRAFAGSAFLSASSYATKYSLTGYSFFQNLNTLRGFKRNRFIGDKIYFTQAELRWPIWDKYLQGVIFLELGEVAEFNKPFSDFVIDYGLGIRFGLPPKYDMKLRVDWGTGRDLQGKRNDDFSISVLQYF